MNQDRKIDQIIETSLPALNSGKETVDSIMQKYPDLANDLRPRLEALVWLSGAKKNLEPRPGFISSTRSVMERQFESTPALSTWQRLIPWNKPQRLAFSVTATAVLIGLLVLIANSLVLTARLSIPGDPLYSTKLFLEDLHMAFTFNQADKAELHIAYTRERTSELLDLALEGNYQDLPPAAGRVETEIIAALHSIQDLPDEPLRQPITGKMRETLSSEIFIYGLLQSSSPPSAHQGIEIALNAAEAGLMALR